MAGSHLPSDHIAPTTSTIGAISVFVLIPPSPSTKDAVDIIQRIRSAHDRRAFGRHPPHVTILPPNQLPPAQITPADLVAHLASFAATVEPFKLILDRVSVLRHSHGTNSIVLEPSQAKRSKLGSQALRMLHSGLAAALPPLDIEPQRHAFRPHLTLAATSRGVDAAALAEEFRTVIRPVEICVDRVTVMTKLVGNGEPYLPAYEVSLAAAAGSSSPPHFSSLQLSREGPLNAYKYNNDYSSWRPHEDVMDALPGHLKLLTYNILNDFTNDGDHDCAVRYEIILHTLSTIDADVIALQEATASFVALMMESAWLRSTYHLSTIVNPSDGSCHLPTGLVILAKQPFASRSVLLSVGKRALVARFADVTIATIHLTSDYKSDKSALRALQWRALMPHLPADQDEPVVVLGDLNTNEGADLEGLVNACGFADAHVEANGVENGHLRFTYDSERNELARRISKKQLRDRIDRVLIRGAGWGVVSCGVDEGRVDGRVGSDHGALVCEIARGAQDGSPQLSRSGLNGTPAVLPGYDEAASDLASDPVMAAFLQSRGSIPDEAAHTARAAAFRALAGFLGTLLQPAPVRVEPVGSFAIGTWSVDSDLDILCVSLVSRSSVIAALRGDDEGAVGPHHTSDSALPDNIRILRIVEDARVPIVELRVDGMKVDLQYCSLPLLVPDVPSMTLDTFLTTAASPHLHPSELQTICSRTDVLAIRARIHADNMSSFRLATRYLRSWSGARGLRGARLGLLPSHALTVLIARVVPSHAISAVDLVRLFFKTYAAWNWEQPVTWVEGQSRGRTDGPMSIVCPSASGINVVRGCVAESTRDLLVKELKRASDLGNDIESIAFPYDPLASHTSFIRIDLYASTASHFATLLAHMEHLVPRLVFSLEKRCPNITPRLWPGWFVESSGDPETSATLVLGLDKRAPAATITIPTPAQARTTFLEVLSSFASDVQRWGGFKSEAMWINVAHAPAADVAGLIPIVRDGGEVEDEDEDGEGVRDGPGSDSEFEKELDGHQAVAPAIVGSVPRPTLWSSAPPPRAPCTKLRSSADVFNRLVWDGGYDTSRYVVGYMDRFVGMLEVGLEEFARRKADIDGDEWIPFHRVWYFRDVDGTVVWDRKQKVDLVFV
ncbi:hypothetical protein HK101_006860 [Irineochytrium annulatum]|nr:hypothetical protein HK101_006860 [Irineochytrium annulatum]